MKSQKVITSIFILFIAIAFASCEDDKDIWVEGSLYWETPINALPITDNDGYAWCISEFYPSDIHRSSTYNGHILDYKLRDIFLTVSSKDLNRNNNLQIIMEANETIYDSGRIPIITDSNGGFGYIDIRDKAYRDFMNKIIYELTKDRAVKFKINVKSDLHEGSPINISLENKLEMRISR